MSHQEGTMVVLNQFRLAVLCWFTSIALTGSSSAFRPSSTAVISHSGPNFETDGSTERQQIGTRKKRRTRNRYYYEQLRFPRLINSRQAVFLTSEHNRYRRQVPATNMEYMYYDKRLAASAQRHADRCDFAHSTDRARGVGENIWAAPYPDFSNAVRLWYIERFHCNCHDLYHHCCGHYTQIVWATSNRFGCGYQRCHYVFNVPYGWHKAILVCHYAPAGNRPGVIAFRPRYAGHPACSECPSHAPSCHYKLCVPRRRNSRRGNPGTRRQGRRTWRRGK